MRVASDLFSHAGKNYLIAVDFYSNFSEVIQLKSISAENVIVALKSIFARHGIPLDLVTVNGPQYSSYQFKEFSDNW